MAVPQARHRCLAGEPAPARRARRRPARSPLSASPPAPARPRVLVVDDEASIRDLLSKTLALAEYDVDLAPDGRTALERLRVIPYDFLITDLKMPGVDGLAVIREARRLKADLPVLIITGYSTEASAIEARQSRGFRLPDQAVPRPARARGGRQSPGRIASFLPVTSRILHDISTLPAGRRPEPRAPLTPSMDVL